jgi:hypothetical protein
MFAKKHIRQGDVLLSAPTIISSSNKPFDTRCYNCHTSLLSESESFPPTCRRRLRFCTAECRDLAHDKYHQVLCGKEFKEASVTSDASGPDADNDSLTVLGFLRVLAICVQAGSHPLQHPLVARLVPQYNTDMIIAWSLKNFISGPIEIFQILGIDVFADPRYDTWVLQTTW